jgi:hypothetical protein
VVGELSRERGEALKIRLVGRPERRHDP